MTGIGRRCALLWALLLTASYAAGDDGAVTMWRIEGAANDVFLLGSVHLLRESDYPLPDVIDEAYRSADALIMELDMDDLDPVVFQSLVNDLGMLEDGVTLESVLGAQRYAQARELAAVVDVPFEMLDGTEPWLAAITVEQLVLARIGFDPRYGVESRLAARAVEDGKEILGFEEIAEQLGFLDSLSREAQSELLLQTLEESAAIGEIMNELIDAWRRGDLRFLENAMLDEMAGYPELYEALVVARNRDWTRQIEALLDDGKSYLIVVGALHLIGKDGVPAMLRKNGVHAVQLQESEAHR